MLTGDEQAVGDVARDVVGDKESNGDRNIEPEPCACYAPIKAEFLKPVGQLSVVSSLSSDVVSNGRDGADGKDRPKLKGMNSAKARRVNAARTAADDGCAPSVKLCSFVVAETACPYGDRCRFAHDRSAYLAAKPPDLGSSCHLFRSFGKCPFGLSCRFAQEHIDTTTFVNLTNADLVTKCINACTETNSLSKEVQNRLRKKTYNFERADRIVAQVLKAERDCRKGGSAGRGGKRVRLEHIEHVEHVEHIEHVDRSAYAPSAGQQSEAPTQQATEAPSDAPQQAASAATDQTNDRTAWPASDGSVVDGSSESPKMLDLRGKLYLAPLTTVGNLPFRRICKRFGADVTCGEMAMATNLLQGQQSEWALLKRHQSEDLFGVQLCGSFPDALTRCSQLIAETCQVDFIDLNVGCPIDLVVEKGGGSALLERTKKLEQIMRCMSAVSEIPVTVKLRSGVVRDRLLAHKIVPQLRQWGAAMATVHGRTRQQRYVRLANWNYIDECARLAAPLPVFGNGDVLSFEDYYSHVSPDAPFAGVMIARGALIKPWLFTEIKERRHWDISAGERLDMLRDYVNFGLEHWGSDQMGVDRTRRFLLEWLSFLHRYIPVGLLERLPQRINEQPPAYVGRNELETLMASGCCDDWVKIRSDDERIAAALWPLTTTRVGGMAGGHWGCARLVASCCWGQCRPASCSCRSTRPVPIGSPPTERRSILLLLVAATSATVVASHSLVQLRLSCSLLPSPLLLPRLIYCATTDFHMCNLSRPPYGSFDG